MIRNRAAWLSALAIGFGSAAPTSGMAVEPRSLDLAGRAAFVHLPAARPESGTRALVIVLHGGLGNAQRIASGQAEGGLNMDAVADRDGFVVAYLNGTPVTRNLGDRFLGWNAGGGCCGQSAANDVDDVGYIGAAIDELARRYGIDRRRVYGIGHSNGAMMVQRVACETPLLAAIVAVSGPLNVDTSRCAAGAGRRILAIQGADDRNVPVEGGIGPQGLSRLAYRSADASRRLFATSGADYVLEIVPGAAHALAGIDARIANVEGVHLAEKAARFFGFVPVVSP